jgi:AcrR family transcriptional regulator
MPARQRRSSERPAPQLTREAIIEVALHISETESDLDALTVRRLAGELGVGAMTLYSYFRNKDEIFDALADEVLGRLALDLPEDESPADAIRAVADAFLSMMRDRPCATRLLAGRVTDSQTALRGGMERVLQRLVNSGLPGPLAVRCYGFLITYALGFATYVLPRPWGGSDVPEAAEWRRRRTHVYAALPTDEFPVMVSLAGELAELPADWQYEAGVEAFIDSTLRELHSSVAEA